MFHQNLSSLRLIRSHLHEWVGLSFGCSFDLPLCRFIHFLIGMTVTHFSKSSTTSFLVLVHFKRLSLDFCQKLKTNQWIPLIFITKIQSCQHSYAGTQRNRASTGNEDEDLHIGVSHLATRLVSRPRAKCCGGLSHYKKFYKKVWKRGKEYVTRGILAHYPST